MVSKQYRIDDDAVAILNKHKKTYSSFSDAIRNMENIIENYRFQAKDQQKPAETTTKALQTVSFGGTSLPDMTQHDTNYWKKLGETVDSCIERAKRY